MNKQTGKSNGRKAPEVPDYLKIIKAIKSSILSTCNCKSTITELIHSMYNMFAVVHMHTHKTNLIFTQIDKL